MKDFERVLVLSPHTDDGEFGCGATIARFIEEGSDIYYAAFSVCEDSVPEGFPRNTLECELRAAASVLGLAPDNLLIYRHPVRKLGDYRQEILEELIKFRNEIQPDLVLMPAPTDIHQDHVTICEEGLRAFKLTSVLGYELPWNNLTSHLTSFVHVQETHVAKKSEALECYKSQSSRAYANEEFIRALARTRGVQIGTHYAEAFQVIRWVIK